MNFHSSIPWKTMYHEKLYHPSQKLLLYGGKTVRSQSLGEKARLQNSIMFYDLLQFF